VKQNAGFTLLEVMIAIAILVIAMTGIVVAENGALDTLIRTKRMSTVAMLAKNIMIEAEREVEGKSFTEVSLETTGNFEEPFADFSWERKIKEITFPNLLDPASMQGGGEKAAYSGIANPVDAGAERIVKIATNFLSKASREITITIKWKEKGEDQSYSVSEYWVDLNHEFQLSE
jgi:prepilin-type N-terminal cleavage/methylation domain-containing protein